MGSRISKGGFTLIEVMAALAITAGLLVTLIYTLNHHLAVDSRHETLTRAVLLARDKLDGYRMGAIETSGAFPAPDEEFSYEFEIKETPFPGVFALSVTVSSGRESVVLKELLREGMFK